MKYNLKVNKSIRYAGFALLILAIAFASLGAASPANAKHGLASQAAIAKYATAQRNSALTDEEKVKAAIDAYFTTRYEGQKLLVAQDFSPLIEDNTLDWVKKEKDKRDIELYSAKLFDLKYVSYIYNLDYDTIEIKNNKATVQLRESHQVVFEATAPTISEMANLQHTITLHYKNGGWLIHKDEYQDELTQEMNQLTKADILKIVDKNYQDQQNRKAQGSLHNMAPLMASVSPLLTTHSYNRSSAVSYADTWATGTNSYYGRQGGTDCASYVSQAFYAGMGFSPPSTSGMGTYGDNAQWYFDFVSKTGSPPWVGVPQQYGFVIGNTNMKGPYGNGSANYLCYVQPGDVVQLQSGTGNPWFHEGIFVAVNGPCTSLSNYLVDAHTTDRYHYPLSNWASYNMRYLLIYGWFGS